MTIKPPTMISKNLGNSGSAILLVLIFMSSLSYLAVSLQRQTKSGVESSRLYETRLQSDLLSDVALNHMILAYMGADDNLRQSIPADGRKHRETINGNLYILEVTAESGKVDLISGRMPLLKLAIDLIYPSGSPHSIEARLKNVQQTHDEFKAYLLMDQLHSDGLRQGIDAYDLFTIFSEQKKLNQDTTRPKLKSMIQEAGLNTSELWGRQRPIYTFSAAVIENGIERPGKSIVVQFQNNKQFEIIAKRYRTWPMGS